MAASDESYFQYAMRLSREHQVNYAKAGLAQDRRAQFEAEVTRSLAEQRDIETSDSISFEQYLETYFRQSAIDPKRLTA